MTMNVSLQDAERRLRQRARELEREIVAKSGGGAVAPGVTDLKDRADEHQRHAVQDAEVERDLAELRLVTRALDRIADGTYGRCADCQAAIDTQRLRAQPAASRCPACQVRAERAAQQQPRGPAATP